MLGVLVVGWTLLSAMRTVVLPRGAHVLLTQMVFQSLRLLFFPLARRLRPFVWWDHLLALFAPIGLLLLPVVWLLSPMPPSALTRLSVAAGADGPKGARSPLPGSPRV